MWVADYSLARPGAATLKAAGAVGVMRYVFPGRFDGAVITAEEIADFNANGLAYGLVAEADAQWILRGYQQGVQIAQGCLQIEQSLGIPRGVTYAASDFDIQLSQYGQALDTLHGLSDGYGGWQYVGVYGSKGFCEWVGANSPITHFWSTDAWSNYTPASNAALHQHAGWPADVPVVDGCDHNLILGDWGPRTLGDDLTPEQDNILRTCARAIVQLAGAVNQHINDEATFRQLVIHGDATHYGFDQLRADIQTLEAAVKAAPGGGANLQPVLDRLNSLTLKAS